MDQDRRDVSGNSEVMLSFFGCSKFLVQVYNTSDIPTGQTFAINWSKIQLLWVLMLYYPYKMMFSRYKLVIVTPCAYGLFVSKVTKVTRDMDVHFWRSFFSAFSVCNDCILITSWLLKLSVLYIHSFMQVYDTTFKIKTGFQQCFQLKCIIPSCAHFGAKSYIYIFLSMSLSDFLSTVFVC